MSVTVQDLTTLNQTTVANNLAVLQSLIQAAYPNTDIKRGPINDLVLSLAAALRTADQTNTSLIQQSNSLTQITANPLLADPTIAANLFSNYQLTANPATTANGTVTIVVSQLIPTVIAQGTTFTTASGLQFTADNVYNGRTDAGSVVNSNDRLMTATSGGYGFTVNVVANTAGALYNIKGNTSLTVGTSIPNLVSAYAAADFTGGNDADTNQTMLNKLAAGAAIKSWSSRSSNFGLLLNQTEFKNILATSEVGYGDAEMLRYHSIFPVAFGGRTDLYVRPQALPQNLQLTKTATLIAKNGTQGTWQFTITSEDAPGFYEVTKIILTTAATSSAGYAVATDTRGLNSSATTFVPDLSTALEATYSRYQTATITFVDTDTNATSLTLNVSTQNYYVYVSVMPLIKDIQDFVNDRNVQNPAGDVLIKAAVPCFTSVAFNINKPTAAAAPNISNIQSLIATAVNNLGFPGTLNISTVVNAALSDSTTAGMTISGAALTGRVRRTDGTNTWITNPQILTLPTSTANMTSSKTTVFIMDPSNVVITVVNTG